MKVTATGVAVVVVVVLVNLEASEIPAARIAATVVVDTVILVVEEGTEETIAVEEDTETLAEEEDTEIPVEEEEEALAIPVEEDTVIVVARLMNVEHPAMVVQAGVEVVEPEALEVAIVMVHHRLLLQLGNVLACS